MNPLPEGFKIYIYPEYRLVTPNHSVPLSRSAGTILAALLSRYGKPVMRDHLFEALWGDDETGGPINPPKVIDVILCRLRRMLRAIGVDFEYKGNNGQFSDGAMTLWNIRECEPYGTGIGLIDRPKPIKKKPDRVFSDDALSDANRAFMIHQSARQTAAPVPAPWTHYERVEVSSPLWTHNARVEASLGRGGPRA